MRRLRAECPWKAEQTHRSLARYLLEETHEALEVLDAATGDGNQVDDAHLLEELGDLLLQVWFHAAIAEERGAFTVDDVAAALITKMVRRNPHVFGPDADADQGLDAAAVDARWQQIKAQELASRERTGPAPLPPTLPALLLATKTLQRRARAGDPVVVRAGSGGPGEDPGARLGDRLLALVAEADAAGLDAEQELRHAVRDMDRRADGLR